MTLAYTRADVNGMAESFFKLTFSAPDADPARFRAILSEMSQDWYEGEGSQTVFKKNFTLVMLDMFLRGRQFEPASWEDSPEAREFATHSCHAWGGVIQEAWGTSDEDIAAAIAFGVQHFAPEAEADESS